MTVALFTGPGVSAGAPDLQTVTLHGAGTLVQDGTLTVTRSLSDPYWGPLIAFDAVVDARVTASVPEAGGPALLGAAALVLAGLLLTRRLDGGPHRP